MKQASRGKEALEAARESNERTKFSCSSCGASSDAPKTTRRASALKCKDCFGKKEDLRQKELNDLSGSDWASLSKSVEQYGGTRSEKQRSHGAAFPQSLAEAQIRIYTKKGDVVLDPFLGVGTTSDAAAALGRRSIGIELNRSFAEQARKDLPDVQAHKIICDDVRSMRHHVPRHSVDFVLTSPPYATLLKSVKGNFAYKWREHSDLAVVANPRPYSTHVSDLGNLEYGEFMDTIADVFSDCLRALKPDSYAVWVVKDYRDLKAGTPYIDFHSDVIRAAELAGFKLWDIRIYDQTKFRPLVVLGYPSRNYYLNIGHSFILIFKSPKGTGRNESRARRTP